MTKPAGLDGAAEAHGGAKEDGRRFSRRGAEAQRGALSEVGIPCVPASLREVPVGRWCAAGTVFPQRRRGAEGGRTVAVVVVQLSQPASHGFHRFEAVRQSLSFHPTRDLETAARRGLWSLSICEIREICG